MPLLDRFTRDEVSAKIWWPLALVFVVAFVLTFTGRGRAIQQVQADAVDWSSSVAEDAIAPALAGGDVSDGLEDEAASLTAALDGSSAGGTLRAVRIWAPDGTLLFSTSSGDELDSQEALNDEEVATAFESREPVALTTEEALGGGASAPQFHVYVAVPGVEDAVAQFEFPESRLLTDVRASWFGYQLIAGIAAIVTLALAGLSSREPIARIGAKVPFYPTSIPKGSAVMDIDEANALKQSGYHARQRVAAMEGRLHELEEENRNLGGDLQRALTALSTSGRQGVPTAIPRAVAPAPAAPPTVSIGTDAASVPTMKVKPERRVEPVTAPTSSADEVAPREATPVRKRRPAPKLEPVVQREPEPLIEPVVQREPEPLLEPVVQREPEPLIVPVVQREPEPLIVPAAVTIEPELVEEPVVVVVPEPDPILEHEPVRSAAAVEPSSDLGPVYEETWVSSIREPEPVDDLLTRITVPGAAPVSAEEASILRAKLARTAALKKPGSRERREATENGQT